jgi:hypothetical protein
MKRYRITLEIDADALIGCLASLGGEGRQVHDLSVSLIDDEPAPKPKARHRRFKGRSTIGTALELLNKAPGRSLTQDEVGAAFEQFGYAGSSASSALSRLLAMGAAGRSGKRGEYRFTALVDELPTAAS